MSETKSIPVKLDYNEVDNDFTISAKDPETEELLGILRGVYDKPMGFKEIQRVDSFVPGKGVCRKMMQSALTHLRNAAVKRGESFVGYIHNTSSPPEAGCRCYLGPVESLGLWPYRYENDRENTTSKQAVGEKPWWERTAEEAQEEHKRVEIMRERKAAREAKKVALMQTEQELVSQQLRFRREGLPPEEESVDVCFEPLPRSREEILKTCKYPKDPKHGWIYYYTKPLPPHWLCDSP